MQTKTGRFYSRYLHSYILMAVLLLATVIFYHSWIYYFPCGDTGLKIGAAKLQQQGAEAYFYTEANGEKVVNGVTATPFLSMLHTPAIGANSCQVKQADFWANMFFLAGCLFFIARLAIKTHWAKACILAVIILGGFIFSRPFYYNLLFGQVYVLYTLIFFILLFLMEKRQYLALGIFWAFVIAIRPIFLPGTILALLYFNRKLLIGLFTGAILVLLITFITGTAKYWAEYSTAMKRYAYEIPCTKGVGCAEWKRHLIADMTTTYSDCATPLTPLQDKALKKILNTGPIFPGLQSWLLDMHKNITNTNFYSVILIVLIVTLALAAKLRLKQLPVDKFVLLVFIFYLISEICVPAVRFRYSHFIWLFAIALLLFKGNIVEILLLIPGLYFFYDYHHRMNQFGELWLFLPCLMYIFRKNENPFYINWFTSLRQKIPFVKP